MLSDDRIDLAACLVPNPENTLVIEAVNNLQGIEPGDLVLLDKTKPPTAGDVVLYGDSLRVHQPGNRATAVAYSVIRFLS